MPIRIRPPSIPKIEDKNAVAKVAIRMKIKTKSNSIYLSSRMSSSFEAPSERDKETAIFS